MMPKLFMISALMISTAALLLSAEEEEGDFMICRLSSGVFTREPIGRVHKNDASAWIEIEPQFEEALKGLEDFSHVWVFWWFDRNDSPGNRRILKVHPRGDTSSACSPSRAAQPTAVHEG